MYKDNDNLAIDFILLHGFPPGSALGAYLPVLRCGQGEMGPIQYRLGPQDLDYRPVFVRLRVGGVIRGPPACCEAKDATSHLLGRRRTK